MPRDAPLPPLVARALREAGEKPASPEFTISVYLDDGRVFEYEVSSPAAAREHVSAIIKTGYRSSQPDSFTHYPPHRISKVKVTGGPLSTNYSDRVRGT